MSPQLKCKKSKYQGKKLKKTVVLDIKIIAVKTFNIRYHNNLFNQEKFWAIKYVKTHMEEVISTKKYILRTKYVINAILI